MATFVKILGIIWLALAVTTIAVGYAGIWWRDGFWAAAELLSPFNVLNFALTIAVLAPGLLLLVWAKRLQISPHHQSAGAAMAVETKPPQDRVARWVGVSHRFGGGDFPVTYDIQMLGYVENSLLTLEEAAREEVKLQRSGGHRDLMLPTLYSAHARLWLLGLYETLRTVRERWKPSGGFEPLKALFEKIEAARMQLAKHEVAGRKGGIAPAVLAFTQESGQLGWHVHSDKTNTSYFVTRAAIADEFLDLCETHFGLRG